VVGLEPTTSPLRRVLSPSELRCGLIQQSCAEPLYSPPPISVYLTGRGGRGQSPEPGEEPLRVSPLLFP
jgi:hypothetical protein